MVVHNGKRTRLDPISDPSSDRVFSQRRRTFDLEQTQTQRQPFQELSQPQKDRADANKSEALRRLAVKADNRARAAAHTHAKSAFHGPCISQTNGSVHL
jgi:hypothetical protein